MNSLTKRWLSLITAISVLTVMCFSGIGTAKVQAADSSAAETPAVIITGTAVTGGSEYTADNIDKEKAYTLKELQEIAGADSDAAADNQYLYSALNTRDTKSIYKAEGVRVNAVLGEAGVPLSAADTNKVTFTAGDGYDVVFDSARENPGTIEKPSPTDKFTNERFYFPNIALENEADGAVSVPSIIAWAEGGEKGSTAVPAETEPYGSDSVRLIVGQLNPKDYNNPLWNGDTKNLIITIGEDMGKVITINGKEYSRASFMAQGSVTASYTYNTKSGEVTDFVKGVPLEQFLSAYDDDDLVKLTAADGYQMEPLTKAQIVEGNYVLAYEKGETADTMKGILETDKEGKGLKGYFTLYGGEKPAKLIDSVSAEAVQEPATAPAAPKTAKATKVNYNTAKVTWSKVSDADGYKIYRSDKTSAVKTIAGAGTLSWTNTGLKTGKSYTYKVKAYKNDGDKVLLSEKSAVTKSVKPALNKPGISGISKGKGYAAVKWTKTAGANGYQLYRATSKTGKYTCIKTATKGTTVTYKNTKLKKGKKYYYKVRAYRTVDGKKVHSAYSAVKYITAK